MAVLNTTSPTDRPVAPTERPSKTVPSSSARIAGIVKRFALRQVARKHRSGSNRIGAMGVQASENCTGEGSALPVFRVSRSSQQVNDGVAAGRSLRQNPRHMQRSGGEDIAVAGAVDQFDAFTGAGELDAVLADDVARTN